MTDVVVLDLSWDTTQHLDEGFLDAVEAHAAFEREVEYHAPVTVEDLDGRPVGFVVGVRRAARQLVATMKLRELVPWRKAHAWFDEPRKTLRAVVLHE